MTTNSTIFLFTQNTNIFYIIFLDFYSNVHMHTHTYTITKDTGRYSLPFSPNPTIFRFYTDTKVTPHPILLPLSISPGFLFPNFHFLFAYPDPPVPLHIPIFPFSLPFPFPYAYCTLLLELT